MMLTKIQMSKTVGALPVGGLFQSCVQFLGVVSAPTPNQLLMDVQKGAKSFSSTPRFGVGAGANFCRGLKKE